MPLHPVETRWFEVHVPRAQTVYALEALAESGSVQLDHRDPAAAPCADTERLSRQLARFEKIAARYRDDLPSDDLTAPRLIEGPEKTADAAVAVIHRWVSDLLGLKRTLRSREREREGLTLLAECLGAMGEQGGSLAAFHNVTGFLFKAVYACPKDELQNPLGTDVVSEVYRGANHDFWVVAGLPEERDIVAGAGALLSCKALRMPDWLSSESKEQRRQVQERLDGLDREIEKTRERLVTLHADSRLREAMASARLLRWYLGVSLGHTRDGKSCRVCGWTTATEPGALQRLLLDAGIDASVVLGDARAYQQPPVHMTSSPWASLFQPFVHLLGTPGRNEVDPSPVLAVAVPLLFGFMFPDVGHGLILAIAGAVLARWRREILILVPCGLAAAAFGAAFGEVFGFHDLFSSPWGSPLEGPFEVLAASLAIGVALILLGLVFAGVEAAWRGETRQWLLEGAPVLVIYLAVLASFFVPYAALAAVGALVWYLAGVAMLCRGKGFRCMGGRIGQLLESALRLGLNTLSFLRVGAFALAHAAFSLVVAELVDAVSAPFVQGIIFVVGHLFIVVFEGAVVMVQTTRLILFEFFIRFLRFEGRIYTPLQRPPRRSEGRSRKPAVT